MKGPLTIEGQWQILGDDRPAPYGTLRVDPEAGLTLEAKMPLAKTAMAHRGASRDPFACPQTIHGLDSRGRPISLLGCMVSEARDSGGMETWTIKPLVGITGGQFESWSGVTARTVRATFSLLDPWLSRSTIRANLDSDHLTFTQRPIPDINIPLPNNEQIVITCDYSQQQGIGELHLTQQHVTHFNFPKLEVLSRVLGNYVHVFRQLLTFLTGSEAFMDSLQFTNDDTSECDVLSGNRGGSSAPRKISLRQVLVRYDEVPIPFPDFVAQWFRYHSEMEAILNLYFTARWSRDMPVTTKFLLLAQALEAYHARSSQYASAVQTRDEFRQRIAALLKAIQDHQERHWLREKLQHANQKTLAQRLSELIAVHEKEAAEFLPDPEVFAATVRRTRNYFTHFDEELRRRGKIPSITALSKLTLEMRALLEICFLRDLGLPDAAIHRVISGLQQVEFVSLEPDTATF